MDTSRLDDLHTSITVYLFVLLSFPFLQASLHFLYVQPDNLSIPVKSCADHCWVSELQWETNVLSHRISCGCCHCYDRYLAWNEKTITLVWVWAKNDQKLFAQSRLLSGAIPSKHVMCTCILGILYTQENRTYIKCKSVTAIFSFIESKSQTLSNPFPSTPSIDCSAHSTVSLTTSIGD